jgi:hypothetical protein
MVASSSPTVVVDTASPTSVSAKGDSTSKARPAHAGSKKPCVSPYSVDANGVRRIRRECL